MNILVVRLGAMGDVIHALPAVAALGRIPGSRVWWAVDPRWTPLLDGNPTIDRIVTFDRRNWASVRDCWRLLRRERFDVAVDLQGLIKSAVLARAAGPGTVVGFHPSQARERFAARLYSEKVLTRSAHVVDRYLELSVAAGADDARPAFWLPPGHPEGDLPDPPFVLACPLAGWRAKQWPLEYYSELAGQVAREGYALVVNGPERSRAELERIAGAVVHTSGIPGLIHATRCAAAVVGVDSGPLHLAAALRRPGIALFGPTHPDRNGPYGGTMSVLRDPGAATTYRRTAEIAPSMRAIHAAAVSAALFARLRAGASR